MDISEVNKASATLAQTVKVLSPIVIALNGADTVFATLKNAAKYKETLAQEVEALKLSADALRAQAEESKAAIPKYDGEAREAHATAKQAIFDARQQAQTQVKDILASVATSTQSAQTAFAAFQADIATKTEALQKAYAEESVLLKASKHELEDAVKALETKLDKLKEQAKKFAASLTAE